MGLIVPFKVVGSESRQKLMEAVGNNKALKAKIAQMSDDQVTQCFGNTQGSLLAMTEKMQEADIRLAQFIASDIAETDGMFIVLSAINYVVDFVNKIECPKVGDSKFGDSTHADEIDNAHSVLFNTEVGRLIAKAIEGVI